MKTITKQFKRIGLLFLLIFSLNIYAQNETNISGIFVRVYNMEGKKINKGYFQLISDTILGLKKEQKIAQINVTDIGFIKTKRSAGHNVLIGSAIGGGTLAGLGAATADPDAWIFGYTAGEGFVAGAILGGSAGAAIGGITALFKNTSTYLINGSLANLKLFAESIAK